MKLMTIAVKRSKLLSSICSTSNISCEPPTPNLKYSHNHQLSSKFRLKTRHMKKCSPRRRICTNEAVIHRCPSKHSRAQPDIKHYRKVFSRGNKARPAQDSETRICPQKFFSRRYRATVTTKRWRAHHARAMCPLWTRRYPGTVFRPHQRCQPSTDIVRAQARASRSFNGNHQHSCLPLGPLATTTRAHTPKWTISSQ